MQVLVYACVCAHVWWTEFDVCQLLKSIYYYYHYISARDPNSGPHTCSANALSTEPSPQAPNPKDFNMDFGL